MDAAHYRDLARRRVRGRCDESALARTCVWCARRLHLPALNPPRPSISPRGLPNAATWNCDAGISRPMRFDGGPECVSCAAAGTEPSRTAGTELSRTEERGRGASNAVQVTSGSTVQNRVARLLSQRRGSAQPRMAASPRFRRVVQGGVFACCGGRGNGFVLGGGGILAPYGGIRVLVDGHLLGKAGYDSVLYGSGTVAFQFGGLAGGRDRLEPLVGFGVGVVNADGAGSQLVLGSSTEPASAKFDWFACLSTRRWFS